MLIHFRHPSLDQLAELGAESYAPDRQRIARHLRDCHRCQDRLRFMRRIERAVPGVLRAELPGGVLDRVLASRAAGVRVIAPTGQDKAPRKTGLTRSVIIAAVLAGIVAMAILSTRSEIVAGESESVLLTTPGTPRAGDRVTVEYQPAVLSLVHADRLILRGRLRTSRDASYGRVSTSRTLDTLRRAPDGAFRGSFILPDSVVYAALVVEDFSGSTVDSRDGRIWTVLVHGRDGKPTSDALIQRENDFMGRSWDEAYASAKLNAWLHPGSVAAWSEIEFFERQLLGAHAADSLAETRRTMLDRLIDQYRTASNVPPDELGAIVWRTFMKKDTAAFEYWYARLVGEDPHHPQVAQLAGVRLSDRYWKTAPRTLLDSLEGLWVRVAPVYGPGGYVINVGQQVARKLGDGKAYLRWVDRAPGRDSLGRTGVALASFAPTREEGMRRIRAALERPAVELQAERPLTLNQSEFARMLADRRRELLAALGEALIAAKKPLEGLDTLSLAISDGWSLQLLKRVAAQRLEAGDTAGALELETKISVDPRTSQARIASITRLAVSRLGSAEWSHARTTAEREMVRETMSRSLLRTIRGNPGATNAAQQQQSLKELTEGKPSVLVYWSRHCGPALEALPAIDSVGRVLRKQGIPVYLVADEAPSPEMAEFFRAHKVGIPVLYDSRREVNTALRNFATPAFYVLDSQGRIRFNEVIEVNDLLLQIRAIQLDASGAR
jgi:thiol-disulfide isomerase/thioredoxin